MYASEEKTGKHEPVIEIPSRTFSIKDVIAGEKAAPVYPVPDSSEKAAEEPASGKAEFTPGAFDAAWVDFTSQLKGEGTRIISMFKSIKPEVENDNLIKIHLSNATQKDTFILNYRQRLMTFLENRFNMPEFDIETSVDLTETNEILYSDEQKQNYLFNKYPILKEMKKNFNLDIT